MSLKAIIAIILISLAAALVGGWWLSEHEGWAKNYPQYIISVDSIQNDTTWGYKMPVYLEPRQIGRLGLMLYDYTNNIEMWHKHRHIDDFDSITYPCNDPDSMFVVHTRNGRYYRLIEESKIEQIKEK